MYRIFLSYDPDDHDEAAAFAAAFGGSEFEISAVGISPEDELLTDPDTHRGLQRVKSHYLRDTDVTIVMVGEHTWRRHLVDWEIAATILEPRSGLLALLLGGGDGHAARLPERLERHQGCTPVHPCPSGPDAHEDLRGWLGASIAQLSASHTGDEPRPMVRDIHLEPMC